MGFRKAQPVPPVAEELFTVPTTLATFCEIIILWYNFAFVTEGNQFFLNPPPLVEDPERFDRASDISLPLPWREGKKGRGTRSVGVTPHLTSPRQRGEDLLCSCRDAPLEGGFLMPPGLRVEHQSS